MPDDRVETETESHPDALAAAAAADAEDPATIARGWLLDTSVATLCTTSVQRGIEGYAFGSVVPFAIGADGRPLVLLASIAAHTANLRRDRRASLFVRQADTSGDPQAGWRLTVLGPFERLVRAHEAGHEADREVGDDALAEVEARYLERVPDAAAYSRTHSFSFWRMAEVVKGRYIAGFGRICWIDGPKLLREPTLDEAAQGAVAHMNEDHRSTMTEMCTGLYGFTPASAEMVSVDRTGFRVRTTGPERLLQFSFGREIEAGDLRLAVIAVLRRARAAVAT